MLVVHVRRCRVRPLEKDDAAELQRVIDRHRKVLADDPGNKFCRRAIANITAELEARK